MTTTPRKNMPPVQFVVVIGSLLLVMGLMAYILDGASAAPEHRAAARAIALYESGGFESVTIEQARRAVRAPRRTWGTRQQGVYTLTLRPKRGDTLYAFTFETDEGGRIVDTTLERPAR